MSAFGRFCWKSRRWKSVKFYTCFDASVLERREGPHSLRPTYSMTLTLALRHVCSIVGHFFPARRNFCGGRKSDFFNRIDPFRTSGLSFSPFYVLSLSKCANRRNSVGANIYSLPRNARDIRQHSGDTIYLVAAQIVSVF